MNRSLLIAGVSCLCFLAAVTGCQRQEAPPPAPELPVIPVSHPISREVTDYVYYTGRLDAVQSVDVRPRVTGYLTKMPFKEGAEVKAGDLLFEVDPRPYQAQFDASKAQVALYESAHRLAHAENERSKAIARRVAASISQEDLEKALSQEAQALAQLELAKASLSLAQLNLDFTHITSAIDGHISRYFYTIGNLVSQDSTLLTTIVTVDPMYVYFDIDELTVQRIRKAINEGRIPMVKDTTDIRVNIGLESEQGYPHEGRHNFVNNTVNQSTGTITVRGVIPNPLPPRGRRLLTPRMFVRVQQPIGPPHQALLVIDRALGTDQGVKYVYVLDAEHKVQYRRVTPGPLEDDGLRVIEEGLKPDDWVVIGALQQVRPRTQVEPEETPMLTLNASADSTASPAASASSIPPAPGEQQKAGAPPAPAKRPSAPADVPKQPSSPPDASKR